MNFGGSWTIKKKKAVMHYLKFFSVSLKNQNFPLYYIDAFAGTGDHPQKEQKKERHGFFKDEDLFSEEHLYISTQGSPSIALHVEPPFDKYIFIEKSAEKCNRLKQMVSKNYPDRDIELYQDDANNTLGNISQQLCKISLYNRPRCVVFLDPFGTQVKWITLERLAKTGVCDIWYLFPTSAINRMLERHGKIPEAWDSKLCDVLGTDEWKTCFYKLKRKTTLFGESEENTKTVNSLREIQNYVYYRLSTIFNFVGSDVLSLYNSRSAIFSLFFVMSSKSPSALKIGGKYWDWLIKKDRKGAL